MIGSDLRSFAYQ